MSSKDSGGPDAIILLGPTASGKTSLLTGADNGCFEVVVADAFQSYRGMNIGTAKPAPDLRARLPHHLLDILDPSEQYTCGDFVRRAEQAIRGIRARGKVPIVSGGSAYYLKSLIFGLPDSPVGDLGVRQELRGRAEREGMDALYQELCALDPVAAGSIHASDRYRILRALEIQRVTGRPRSAFAPPAHPRTDLRFDVVGVAVDRVELRKRIEQRVEDMFRAGLVDEVRGLLRAGYGADDPGMRGIGYREFLQMRLGCTTYAAVRDCVVANTARLAKRQATFFRSIPDVTWIGVGDTGSVKLAVDTVLVRGGVGD